METTEKKEPVIAKMGKPVAVDIKINTQSPSPETTTPGPEAGAETPEQIAAREKAEKEKGAIPEFNNEHFLAFLKKEGIEASSIDDIKAKFAPPPPDKTEAEKKADADKQELRVIEKFVASGGTPEQYASLKNVLTMDDIELARTTAIKELHDAGIKDEKVIDEIIKARYFQIELDNIKRDEDNETEAEFEKRKADLTLKATFGSTKMKGMSATIKKQAETILNNLKKDVESEDAEKTKETTFLSNVDKSLKNVARTIDLDLGKEEDKELGSVPVNIPDDVIEKVRTILIDPAQRKQYFFNEDGSLNPDKAIELILRNEALTNVARSSFIKGRTDTVNEFRKRFPDNPNGLGVGGKQQQANTGKIASAGAPVRVNKP